MRYRAIVRMVREVKVGFELSVGCEQRTIERRAAAVAKSLWPDAEQIDVVEFESEEGGMNLQEFIERHCSGKGFEPEISACPRCGREQEDFDGFGVIHCRACGYCKHPSAYDGKCDICGEAVE